MYQGFWGLLALSAVLLGYSAYTWKKETAGKKLAFALGGKKEYRGLLALGALLGLCAVGVMGGILLVFGGADSAVVHVAGLVTLLASFAFYYGLRRTIPKIIKEEKPAAKEEEQKEEATHE